MVTVSVSSVRLAVPRATIGEIIREDLLNVVLNNQKKIVFVQGGAGYGKTTLLSQIAASTASTVWLTLDGENDVFAFLNILGEALRQVFPDYDFSVSEYLPFEENSNFITIIADAFISSIEKLKKTFTVILDDLHTIEAVQIKQLIACITKYKPENIRLCYSSREAPWNEFVPMRVRGNFLEFAQQDLAFTRDETVKVLGFYDDNICNITEGWPLAVSSFKMLLESGVSVDDVLIQGNEGLHAYLFYECINRLPPEIVYFLKASACFEELDPQMMDTVLETKNTRLILESLVSKNIFTIKTDNGLYRFHALFREYLLKIGEGTEKPFLQHKAALYYYNRQEYSRAAKYAISAENKEFLQQIILAGYKYYIRNGDFSELGGWFQALGGTTSIQRPEVLVAKGAFLSSIGNFSEAKECLDAVVPLLKKDDKELYIEAMVHKARVLRNFVSFEESNKLLDQLLYMLDSPASELSYSIAIEKLYNLCWNSQVKEAYDIVYQMITVCAKAGNLKVKAWFERYLCTIHFFAGKMKDAVYYYERSLEIPEDERKHLDIHSIGMFAAKAYQMLGERSKSLNLISNELQKLRSTGRYEELWSSYLLAAEIHYQNAFIDRMNGGSQTFESTMRYFTLADEYAPLYRNTEFQMQWAKMQRLSYILVPADSSNPHNLNNIINEIFTSLDKVGDYLKTAILARLFGYYSTAGDDSNSVKCAKMCIEIGEKSGLMLLPTLAYGILARAAIAMNMHEQAVTLTERYMQLCYENGVYEYFKMRKAYDSILEFAFNNGIAPDFTKQMMVFAGYKPKKAYIQTLGGFYVFAYNNMQEPIKMRTKKERELLAFLLDAGSKGVTKEQIYNAIWSESESDNVKKLIGVNLAQIKKDLSNLGIKNCISNHEKHYSICKDEIVLDIDLFDEAYKVFQLQHSRESIQKILSLYKGEYLSDFEALWAAKNRIKYSEAYKEVLELC